LTALLRWGVLPVQNEFNLRNWGNTPASEPSCKVAIVANDEKKVPSTVQEK
jgi:hypothetical protein